MRMSAHVKSCLILWDFFCVEGGAERPAQHYHQPARPSSRSGCSHQQTGLCNVYIFAVCLQIRIYEVLKNKSADLSARQSELVLNLVFLLWQDAALSGLGPISGHVSIF